MSVDEVFTNEKTQEWNLDIYTFLKNEEGQTILNIKLFL